MVMLSILQCIVIAVILYSRHETKIYDRVLASIYRTTWLHRFLDKTGQTSSN